MPSWSRTEGFGATVAATGDPAESGTPSPLLVQSLGDTAYAIKRPAITPAQIPQDDPLIGKKVDHFEIRALVGEGGMGRVYLAHDLSLERPVALKMLRMELADTPELVTRLIAEARAQARIQHPHVVNVYYIGEYQGAPYIAMEYVEGQNLAEYLTRNGPLSWQDALEVIIQTARALFHAHLKLFSHRDVKPSNIILTQGSQYRSSHINIKVADFGLAAPVGRQEEHFMGTPRYAAPELVDGRRHDHRSDIYALGITFYELLTGQVPFDATSLSNLFVAHRSSERPEIPEHLAPWRLRRLITEMMDADPMKRPTTYEELLAQLTSLRPKPVVAGGIAARSFAWAVDLALVAGVGQLISDGLYLVDTTATQAVLMIYCVYYVTAHRLWGATLGKRIMGLRIMGMRHAISAPRLLFRFLVQFWGPILAVIMISLQMGAVHEVSNMSEVTDEVVGQRIPILQQALEPVLRQVLLPNVFVALPWLGGFLFAFFDVNRMTLHDRAAATKVVYTVGEEKKKQDSHLPSLRVG